MKKLFNVKSVFKNKAAMLGIATFMVLAGSAIGLSTKTVLANDCSANAIMHCGTSSPRDFISKINANTQPDLKAIYANYNLAPSEYSKFVTSARPGLAYKDGTIRVDGRVVATGAESLGRTHFSYTHSKVIAGHTYWESRAQDVFLSNSIPVMVLFNAKGQMQFAVMYNCGNPTNGHPNNPTFACNNLIQKQVDRDTYQFSTSASAGNGASINHVVYNFGDGQTKTETNPATVVTHNYAKAGSYTAKVTVYVNVPGSQTYAIAAAGECIKHITVAPAPPAPVAACESLKAVVTDRTRVALTATASAANGATISAYNFSIRNSSGSLVASKTVATTAKTATATENITAAGTYSAIVTVTTSLGVKTSTTCRTNFTITPVPPTPLAECKELKVVAIDRTNFTLNATASATNGATIQGYDFVVKNSANSVAVSKSVATTGQTASTNVSLSNAGTYTAQVTVRTSLGARSGPQCTATITVTPPATPGVTITKHVDNVKLEQVAVGQNFVYEVVIKNTGEINLTNVAVTDPAPQGVTMLSTDQGTIANNALSLTIPSLKIGESFTVNITAKVMTYMPGNIVNTACVNAPEVNPGQPNENDACDTATVTVTPPVVPPTPKNPNITITKMVDNQKQEQVAVGQNFVYEVVIKNTGEINLTNVAVTDPAPQGVTMLSTDQGTIANNALSLTIPSLKIGESFTVNITAKVMTYMPGNIVNTACVNAPEVNPGQPNENDACDTATVTVTPPVVPPTTPSVLPNTGAGNTIGLFSGVVIASTLGYRLFLGRKLTKS